MSLDVSADCCACGHEVMEQNITYNVAPIYYRALRAAGVREGLRGLDGMTLADAAEPARRALAFMSRHRAKLEDRYTPSNGWGSIECVYRVLGAIVDASVHSPTAVLSVR